MGIRIYRLEDIWKSTSGNKHLLLTCSLHLIRLEQGGHHPLRSDSNTPPGKRRMPPQGLSRSTQPAFQAICSRRGNP